MAFIGDIAGGIAEGAGSLIGKFTGAERVEAAAAEQQAEAKRQADIAQATASEQASGIRGALGTAQGFQTEGYKSAMEMMQPYAAQGMQGMQQYSESLQGGPQQFTGQDSQFRDQMLGIMNQGQSQLGQDVLGRVQQDTGLSSELQQMMTSPLEVGALEESRGYGAAVQARKEAMDAMTTGAGATGMMFSGARAKGLSDISGREMQQLEQQSYNRAAQERMQNIGNRLSMEQINYGRGQNQISQLMGLEQQQYGRGQTQFKQLAGLEQTDYGRDLNLQKMNYGSQQDQMNRLQQMGAMGLGVAGQQAGMAANYGNLMGAQTMGAQQNIANLMTGGTGQAANLMNMGGQYAMQGAQARQESMGDIIGAGAAIFGGMG